MRFAKLCLAGIFLICFHFVSAQRKHASETRYPTYNGLIMAGYQGWFRASGDGTGAKRFAYGDETRSGIDMWPDVSEYEKTYATPFKLANGSQARFFSSIDKSTVDVHFRWMQQYGIDGVFTQRFFGAAKNRDSASAVILKNAFEAASKYNRAIALMYGSQRVSSHES